MTKLILIRHGQTEWNLAGRYQGQSNVALSPDGIQQAQQLARNFPIDRLDAVYTSDLKRAAVTAAQLAERFQCPLHPETALREMDFGDWEGLTYEQIAARWPEEVQNFFGHPEKLQAPHGETFARLQQRAMKEINEIVARETGKTIAVVAHGAINRTILTAVLHMSLHDLWTLRQDNTAVNILRFEDGYTMLELMNSTAHLPVPPKSLI